MTDRNNGCMTSFDIRQVSGSSIDADGFVGISCDWIGNPVTAGAQQAEAHHPLGFIGIPMDPTVGASPDGGETPGTIDAASNALQTWEGDRCHAIALNDPRAMGNLPNWNKGDAAVYAPSGYGNFVRCREDGRVEVSTRTSANDADVYLLLDPNGTNGAQPGFSFVAPWGNQGFTPQGWSLRTQWGASVDIGGFNSGNAVINDLGLTSSIRFRSSMFSVNSSAIKLGAGAGQTPIALAVQLAAVLETILTQLTVINSFLAATATAAAATGTPLLAAEAVGSAFQAVGTATGPFVATTTALLALVALVQPAGELPFASKTTSAL